MKTKKRNEEELNEKLVTMLTIAANKKRRCEMSNGFAALLYCITGAPVNAEQKDAYFKAHPEMDDDTVLRAYPTSDQAIAFFERNGNIDEAGFEVAPYFKEDFEAAETKSSAKSEGRGKTQTFFDI